AIAAALDINDHSNIEYNYKWSHSPITIFTDSQYVCGVIEKPWRTRRNVDIIHNIRNYVRMMRQRGIDIQITWIKAHCGIPGNEAADKLANEAMIAANNDSNHSKSVKPHKTRYDLSRPKINGADQLALNEIIDEKEVEGVFKAVRVNGALGPDHFSPYVLRQAHPTIVTSFTMLFNFSLKYSVMPMIWRTSLVCTIYKTITNHWTNHHLIDQYH